MSIGLDYQLCYTILGEGSNIVSWTWRISGASFLRWFQRLMSGLRALSSDIIGSLFQCIKIALIILHLFLHGLLFALIDKMFLTQGARANLYLRFSFCTADHGPSAKCAKMT